MSVFRHSAGLALAQFSEKILSFSIILLASRILKTEGIGEFFYYFSLVCLFIPLMDLGLEKILLQRWFKTADGDRPVLMTRLVALKLAGGLAALILALGADALVRWGHANPKAIFACFVAIFSSSMGDLLRRPRFTEQRISLDILVPILSRLLTLVGVIALLHHFVHGYQLAYLYAVANVIGMLVSLAGIQRCWPVKFSHLNRAPLNELFLAGIPFSLTSLFVMLSLYVDSVMLGHYNLEEVGAYGAAYRIILVVAGLSGGTARVLFPQIVKMANAGDQTGTGRALARVLRVHLMLFGTISIGGFFMADHLMTALYGMEFESAGRPFRILAGLILLVSFTNVIGQSLEAMGYQKKTMRITLLAALFNLGANFLLIPRIGMIGAAITTVITESIILVAQGVLLRNFPKILRQGRYLTRGLLFLIPVAGVFALLPELVAQLDTMLPVPTLGTWVAVASGGLAVVIIFLPFKTFWLKPIKDGEQ
ncbi:flippase [Pontiellaceae bacterium B12227]|nr:flippase [Pontiellaceae bacterium B12227]